MNKVQYRGDRRSFLLTPFRAVIAQRCKSLVGLLAAQGAFGQDRPEMFLPLGHSLPITCVRISYDGQFAVTGSLDNTLKVWVISAGQSVRGVYRTITGHQGPVNSVNFSPDRTKILSASSDQSIAIWKVSSGSEVHRFLGHTGPVNCAAYSPDGALIISGSNDGTLRLWDINAAREIRSFQGHDGFINSAVFSPDGQYVLSSSTDKTARLWEIRSGREIRSFSKRTDGWVNAAVFSPRGDLVLCAYENGALRLWDTALGGELRSFAGHKEAVTCATFRDDKIIASGGRDNAVRLWDASSGHEIRTLTGHLGAVNSVSFSRDGRTLVSAGVDMLLRIWDVQIGKEIESLNGFGKPVHFAGFSSDGQTIISADKQIHLWDMANVRLRGAFGSQDFGFNTIVMSPDGRFALSASDDQNLGLWDVLTGQRVAVLGGHTASVNSGIFSYDGQRALSASDDGTIKLWDVASTKAIRTFSGHSAAVTFASFSPDGTLAVSSSKDRTVKIWDVASGTERHSILGHTAWVSTASFSPDGTTVLSSGWDRAVRLWDAAAGTEIRSFLGHSGVVSSAVFSPDGRLLLSASWDNTLRIWELASGRELRTLHGHLGWASNAVFSPDGRFVVSASCDGTVRLWSVDRGAELLSMASFDDGQWVAVSPEGYYASSSKGDEFLRVRRGARLYRISDWRKSFYNPDIVEAIPRFADSTKAVASVRKQGGEFIQPPLITVHGPPNGYRAPEGSVTISFSVHDPGLFILSVRLFVGGRPVVGDGDHVRSIVLVAGTGLRIPSQQHTLSLRTPVRLEPGANRIEIVAFNGVSEGHEILYIVSDSEASAKPSLWIAAVGINSYKGKGISSLSYASADASAVVDIFSQQHGKAFSQVHSLLVADGTGLEPTKDNVLGNIETFKGSFMRQAGRDDVFILFLAGHGVLDSERMLLLLPSDAARHDDGSVDSLSSIEWTTLSSLLAIPARRILIIDACHAGGINILGGRNFDTNRIIKAHQDAGTVILTASQAGEESRELQTYRHGAFTQALIEGLQGSVIRGCEIQSGVNKRVTMKALENFLYQRVSCLTNNEQHPATFVPAEYDDYTVSVLP